VLGLEKSSDKKNRPTRIMIDGLNLALEQGTGIATYARGLSHALHENGNEVHVLYGTRSGGKNKLMQEIAFFDPMVGSSMTWNPVKAVGNTIAELEAYLIGPKAKPIPMSGAVIREHFKSRLPYFDQIWNSRDMFGRATRFFDNFGQMLQVRIPVRPDIMHWTYPVPISVRRAKNIYTIHDLVPLRLPYTTLDTKRRYYRMLRVLRRSADHFVTVSETSKKDIVNLLGIKEERVTNTYQSVSVPPRYANKTPDVVQREIEGTFDLTYKGYMLFFGAIEPKKNIGRLLEAYLSSNIATPLVIVGKMAWKSDQELQLLNDDVVRYLEQEGNRTITRKRIYHLDYAPYPLLVSLIKGAKAVLFPSLYEGFGLPVVEAMALGTPALTSTGGSMPEVAGDAALLVDPYNVAEIAQGIIALDTNAELRAELSAKGLVRAQYFTPEKHEARVAEMYARILNKGGKATNVQPVSTEPVRTDLDSAA
jgi:glycosyltransferase involved in cell wall biosynthesis